MASRLAPIVCVYVGVGVQGKAEGLKSRTAAGSG